MSDSGHVVVVGAGIVGVSAALTLAERGAGVTVIDRGEVGGEASGVNAGSVAGGGWGTAANAKEGVGAKPELEVALKMGSRERFLDLVDERGHDIGLDRSGSLMAIRTPEEWAWAEAVVDEASEEGRALELVDGQRLTGLEPAADAALLGAIFDPLNLRAEPLVATRAFAREARRHGAVIETGRPVTSLAATGDGSWEVETPEGMIGADAVILAAGAWCAALGAMVGVRIPITPVRGQMWASAPQPPMMRHVISAAESSLAWHAAPREKHRPPHLTHSAAGQRVTRHLYGRQRPNGEIVFGGDRVLGDDRSIDPDGIEVNHGQAAEVIPALGQLAPARTWSGLMPFSLDGRPLIGSVPDRPGLFLAGGLASSGFGRGPMTGRLIAELAMGDEPSADLSPATLDRRVLPL